MKINIYYGGRGILDDPTLYVLKKMESVFEELRVKVERFDLFEQKNTISSLPQTLKDADGIILATTIEWYGIGGCMQQFLDSCWLYGDKEKISTLYMMPVVMSTTYGEREGKLSLINSWEILGGIPCNGICSYIEDAVSFEMNKEYAAIIEKEGENLYRTISQKIRVLPTSNQAVKQNIYMTQNIDLTPQESEQLSKYVADETFVQKQKEDIKELSSLFKSKLENRDFNEEDDFLYDFNSHFKKQEDFKAVYKIMIKEKDKPLVIEIENDKLNCYYGELENADVIAKLSEEVMNHIIFGRMTFQRAFMSGEMTAKGNFKTLRMLDQIFEFTK